MKNPFLNPAWLSLTAFLAGSWPTSAESVRVALTITAPITRQVIQRDGKNGADVIVRGTVTSASDAIEASAELVQGATSGKGTDWVEIAKGGSTGGEFNGKIRLSAGGWYKISVRVRKGGQIVAEASIDKAGIGEVFVTAGQSNSANFGTPKQTAQDDRVVYFDGKSFLPAQDPIPGGCGGGGSPWSIMGDLVAKSQGVPVCFRSASLTWTEVKNWMPPDTQLYKNLAQCVKAFGPGGVRAVLWHQGESDTLVSTSAATYCERLQAVIEALNKDCEYPLPWVVAKASFHPGSQPPQQKEVALGQQMLWDKKISLPGPNTDELLGDTYRSDGVHFNDKGLHKHGQLWAEKISAWLDPKTLNK